VTPEQTRSQLPQEPEYWELLAREVRDDAAAALAAYARTGDAWYGLLARSAPWLVAASAAAILVLWLALPARQDSLAFRWMASFAVPSERAGSLVSGTQPPSVDALMVQFPPADEETQ